MSKFYILKIPDTKFSTYCTLVYFHESPRTWHINIRDKPSVMNVHNEMIDFPPFISSTNVFWNKKVKKNGKIKWECSSFFSLLIRRGFFALLRFSFYRSFAFKFNYTLLGRTSKTPGFKLKTLMLNCIQFRF